MIRHKKIYILLQSQKLSHEDFNDDPEVLMGLPPAEKKTEFWKRYDRQADTHDNKMTDDLIMRADNNTLGPADLSTPFTLSSNSVIVNCLLYASLSCSLLAAVVAMMAKEWLQSFDRTGQTGPLEEQGRFRQRKFNGVEQWHLGPIIRSLPNILLLSVILFFAGVCLFLFPVNKAVAGVVIAFSGGGAILCGGTIVAGATSPLCPYQSAASRALKRMGLLFSFRWWKGQAKAVVDLVVQRLPKLARTTFDATAVMQPTPTALLSTIPNEAGTSGEAEVAQAAGWLLGTASSRADQIAAAQFICTLGRTADVFAFQDPETRRRLVFLTGEAFDIWYSQRTQSNREIAELLGLVLCRVLLQPGKYGAKREDLANLQLYQSGSFGGSFLREFGVASTSYVCHGFEDQEIMLHIAFLLASTSEGTVIPEYPWTGLSRLFLTQNIPHLVDVLLGIWAQIFCNFDTKNRSFDRSHIDGEPVSERDNETVLVRELSGAVISGTRVLSSLRGNLQSERHAMHGYTACLRRAGELSPQIPQHEVTKVIHGIVNFILSYVDPLASSNLEQPDSELVRVSIEAVLGLQAFIGRDTNGRDVRISRDPRAEERRIDDLIDAAVRIMFDDSERLTHSELFPRPQPQTLAWFRAHALASEEGVWEGVRAQARERERARARAREWERERERERERARAREREREQEERRQRTPWLRVRRPVWDRDREEASGVWELWEDAEREVEQAAERALDGPHPALRGPLRKALFQTWKELIYGGKYHRVGGDALHDMLRDGLVDTVVDEFVDAMVDQLPSRLRGQALELAKLLARRLRVESSILRILLWVCKTSANQGDHSDKRKIFVSSCRLWAPLETRVDFTINGIEWGMDGERLTVNDGNWDKLLTSDDLNGMVEFAEDLQKDRKESEFITHGADVGINRLYVHFNRRVDWNYDLYDLREQRTFCPRSRGKGLGLMW
ncbi:hypothetical protein FRC00_012721 [Tulasnella sp. 408]|nr:hypothetical protein FRC00_012721 [Tulasnella sp. 408]